MMFGLMLVPILMAAGLALDVMRSNSVRTKVAEAVDAGLLAAARAKSLNPALTDGEMQVIARRVFDANVDPSFRTDDFRLKEGASEGQYTIDLDGEVETVLLRLVGIDDITIDIGSEVEVAPPRRLEVALALDNTFSMTGTKMDSLRTAANNLVNILMKDGFDSVYIGVVPFARHVNLGMGVAGQSWMNVPADSSYERNECNTDSDATRANGCTRVSSTCETDGVSRSCQRWECPNGVSVVRQCQMVTQPTTWLGCVGSRPHPLNIQDTGYLANRIIGVLNHPGGADCPAEILPLTNVKSTVETALNNLVTQGNTYIPSGLSWGYRILSPSVPYNQGETYENIEGQFGLKTLILMTDGENTASPSNNGFSAHYGSDGGLADTYSKELCIEIKSKKIDVYTIAFEVTDFNTKKLLEDCASSEDAFFDAKNPEQLSAAFTKIANNLVELSLSK